jgi:hypothetical protein
MNRVTNQIISPAISRGNPGAAIRFVLDFLLVVAGVLTAVLIVRTCWYVFHSMTNTPYTDSWLLLEELRRFPSGKAGWAALWSPYWGQRVLVARLAFLASLRLASFSTRPMILANIAALIFMLVTLVCSSTRMLFGSPRLAWAAGIAFANLVLSSLGLEVVLIPHDIISAVGYAASITAVVLFERRPVVAVLLALLATGSITIGLLVWPILLVEAWLLQKRPRTRWILAALTSAMFALYLADYTRPQSLGMGISAPLHHPLQFLRMLSLVLGGPITLHSLRLGTVAGAAGLVATGYLATTYFTARKGFAVKEDFGASSGVRTMRRSEGLPFLTACLLLVCIAASMVVGRISPAFIAELHGAQPLPSRYLIPMMVFWGCLFALVLARYKAAGPPRNWLATGCVGAVVLVMTFGTWSWQWRLSREWAIYFQKFDAIGSGFLAGVSDPELMSLLFTDGPRRDELVDYMRREHLAVFAEPRARWIGVQAQEIVKAGNSNHCRAKVARIAVVNGFRITGEIDTGGWRTSRQTDVVIANNAGMIVGLGRTLPAESEFLPETEFLGYALEDGDRLFMRLGDHSICESLIGPVP